MEDVLKKLMTIQCKFRSGKIILCPCRATDYAPSRVIFEIIMSGNFTPANMLRITDSVSILDYLNNNTSDYIAGNMAVLKSEIL